MNLAFQVILAACALPAQVEADKGPVTHSRVVPLAKRERPGYLEPYVDPVFKSTVTRITGDPGTLIPGLDARWDRVARHTYSKFSAWNCDQSLVFLGTHHGFPSMLFLDGSTYTPKFGRNKAPGTEMRWHATRPHLMVFVKDNTIGTWNVVEDRAKVVAAFPGYTGFKLGPWEGNLSADGSRLAIHARKEGRPVAFAYDLGKKRKYPDIPLGAAHVDWVSISASGSYIVVNGTFHETSPAGRVGGPDRTRILDLDGRQVGGLWIDSGRPSHYDLTLDANGEDIAVGVSNSKPDEGRVIKRRLRDGHVTVLTPGGYAGHASARNVKRPGWAYATYQHREPSWKPYWDEVVAIKLDGSMTVERIAHLHAPKGDYLAQAQAVPSPDGLRVLWASSWYGEGGRPVGAYVARVAGR